MNVSQDQFDPTNPTSPVTWQSLDQPLGEQEAEPAKSIVRATTADSATDIPRVPLWSLDDELGIESDPNPANPISMHAAEVDLPCTAWPPQSSKCIEGDSSKRFNLRDEEAIRHWVQKTTTDPTIRSIRQGYFGYCLWVFHASGSGVMAQPLSYSAFCRRVAAEKGRGSALRRTHLQADYRTTRKAELQAAAQESLWVQVLPAQHASPQHAGVGSGAVAIAVDSRTGAVRIDSQIVGAVPADDIVVSAVRRYRQQHGHAPQVVCVDGSDFHHAPRLAQLCRRLGIELRVVYTRPSSKAWTLSASEPTRPGYRGYESTSTAGTGKILQKASPSALWCESVLPSRRRHLNEIALRINGAHGRRNAWPREPSADHKGEGAEQ